MDSAEIKRLAAEVSIQHGIRVDPDDPMMAVVTLNRLMLESAINDALRSIRAATEEFNCAAERLQIRAGSVLAQEVRESVVAVRSELQKDIENARVKACELIDELHRGQSRPSSIQGKLLRGIAGAALFAAGLLVGILLR